MKSNLGFLSTSAFVALMSCSALADTQTLESTSVEGSNNYVEQSSSTVSKMDIDLKDTPRSVTVFNEQFIEDIGAQGLGDLFDYMPGVNTRGTADRYFAVRGQSVSINNVLMDGLRTSQGGEGGTGSRFPSTFNAGSVEFLKGPSGTLYGAGSGFGLVNINTKKPQAQDAYKLEYGYKSYISADTGYFDRKAFSWGFDATGAVNDEGTLLYRVITREQPNNDMFQKGRSEDNKFLNFALTFKPDETLSITPKYVQTTQRRTSGTSYGDGIVLEPENYAKLDGSGKKIEDKTLTFDPKDVSKVGNRGHYYGSPNDFGVEEVKETTLFVNKSFSKDWSAKVKLTSKTSSSKSDDMYASYGGSGNADRKAYMHEGKMYVGRKYVASQGENKFNALDASVVGKSDLGFAENSVAVGFNFSQEEIGFARAFQPNGKDFDINVHGKNNYIEIGDPSNQQIMANPNLDLTMRISKTSNSNFYVSDALELGDAVLFGGLSKAHQVKESIASQKPKEKTYNGLSKNAGLVYKISEGISAYSSYSYAFEPQSKSMVDGSDLKPKETSNMEIGTKMRLANMSIDVTGFMMDVTNEPSGYEKVAGEWRMKHQSNSSSYQSRGLEAVSYLSPMSGLNTMLAYSLIDAFYSKDDSSYKSGDKKSLVPTHTLSAWNTYGVNDRLRLGLGVIFESEKFAKDQKSNSKSYKEVKLPARFQVDLSAYYKLSNNTNLAVSVKNVLDEKRIDSGSTYIQSKPNTPRSISFNITHIL